MSGKSFLLDSNIIIRLSKQDSALIDFVHQSSRSYISIITYMEVLGYAFKSEAEFLFVKELISLFELIHIDQAIADQTIKLRQSYKIKLPDAIIAATAQVCDCTLVTANIDDFKLIKEIDLLAK